VIELIGKFNRKLLAEPHHALRYQTLKRTRVQVAAFDDCQFGADFALEVYYTCQSDSQDQLYDHEVPERTKIVVLVLLVLMSYEEVDENVQQLRSNYYQI